MQIVFQSIYENFFSKVFGLFIKKQESVLLELQSNFFELAVRFFICSATGTRTLIICVRGRPPDLLEDSAINGGLHRYILKFPVSLAQTLHMASNFHTHPP